MQQQDTSLKIALLQSPLHWEDPQRNRDMFASKCELLADDIDVIVLPEMFTTGFTMSPQNIDVAESEITVDWMKNLASEKGAALIGSTVFQEGRNYFNRLFFVTPEGATVSYDKRHTFTLAGEHRKYKAGKDRLLVRYKGFTFCPLICYDLRFPVWSRNTEDYDVLLYVANWPAPRITAWDILLKARAIENMAYCIGVNRVGSDNEGHEYPGHTAAYDPLGSMVAYSEKEEVVELVIMKREVDNLRTQLRFLEDRDYFTLKG